ncbi:MAG: diguanylate cyclase, partial [Nitrospirota bacterium]|nr:diguanylate cyclase [Nitrospirota bacterium]
MQKENVSILVANNNPPEINVIRTALSDHHDFKYKINIARSGVDTIKKASESKFDVLLMYQNLPGIDGIKMLKKITEKKLDMPVIMVIAEGDDRVGVQAMDEGAYDYLTREEVSRTDSLNRAIRRAMQRKKLESDIRESVVKLEKLAIRDGLTGLFNHKHFREEIKTEYKKAKRHLQHLSCIMLDLDNFKAVNDNFGHQFGDFVIAR